ncbi:MAG: hypothetical protein H6564_00195 [Lewinellaceae bacterium]|nr:hypothetical protein [Lewinellaceae bacterium]
MFHRIISFLLIGALALASGREAMIGLWYLAKRQQITEQYCINKNAPELMCQGKCHLKKVMEGSAPERQEIPLGPPVQERLPFHALIGPAAGLYLAAPAVAVMQTGFFYRFSYCFEPARSLLRPPWA